MTDRLRLFLALGPGDIVGGRRKQLSGETINETSIAFSEQLFAYCQYQHIQTLAISSHSRIDRLEDGDLIVENFPKPLRDRRGLQFHLSQILYGIYLAFRARQFNADIAVIDSGTTHYFVLILIRLLGIPVVVNLHNVLWPCGYPPKGIAAIMRRLNGLFFRYAAAGAIGVSPECERQVSTESRGAVPFFQYRCQFRSDGFKRSEAYETGAFRVVFAGRAEENKGVLDIARIAGALRTHAPVKVVFDICGDGPALARLKEIIERDRLNDVVTIHGRLERDELLHIYAASHAAIVPTRSNFTEGMPQVCAEAVLSDLPVITSKVANAFDVIGLATIRAETDDVESYVNSIISLIENQELHARLRSACKSLSQQFLDRNQSYPAALDRVLEGMTDRRTMPRYEVLFDRI
jgi:glycogen synthase